MGGEGGWTGDRGREAGSKGAGTLWEAGEEKVPETGGGNQKKLENILLN